MAVGEILEPLLAEEFHLKDQQLKDSLASGYSELVLKGLYQSGANIELTHKLYEADIVARKETFLALVKKCRPGFGRIPRGELLGSLQQFARERFVQYITGLEKKLQEHAAKLAFGQWGGLTLGCERVLRAIDAELGVLVWGDTRMGEFDEMMGDTVILVKLDGRRIEDIRAQVERNTIIVMDTSLPIEEGDTIERPLRNGLMEKYIVEDRGLLEAPGLPSMSHYEVRVRKLTALAQEHRPVQNISVSGPNARVNIGSVDRSTNVMHAGDEALFVQLRQALAERVTEATELKRLQEKVDQLEAARGTPRLLLKYQELIAVAADHMTVLEPFLPALARLLAGGGS